MRCYITHQLLIYSDTPTSSFHIPMGSLIMEGVHANHGKYCPPRGAFSPASPTSPYWHPIVLPYFVTKKLASVIFSLRPEIASYVALQMLVCFQILYSVLLIWSKLFIIQQTGKSTLKATLKFMFANPTPHRWGWDDLLKIFSRN